MFEFSCNFWYLGLWVVLLCFWGPRRIEGYERNIYFFFIYEDLGTVCFACNDTNVNLEMLKESGVGCSLLFFCFVC